MVVNYTTMLQNYGKKSAEETHIGYTEYNRAKRIIRGFLPEFYDMATGRIRLKGFNSQGW